MWQEVTVGSNREKRRFERIAVVMPTEGQCTADSESVHRFAAKTRDVSARGACISLDRSNGFKAGQDVEMAVDFVRGEVPIEVRGLVHWIECSPDPELEDIIGIELTGMRGARGYERWLEMLSWHSP